MEQFQPYVLAQFQRAIDRSRRSLTSEERQRITERVTRWAHTIENITTGKVTVGSREPVKDTPSWVTLEVVHGGFATGRLVAEGPLLRHELEWLRVRGKPLEDARRELNSYFLSEEGQRQLLQLLESGAYRIGVPEEAALLTIAWLLENGQADAALQVLEQITPFLARLRFYPEPDSTPPADTTLVHLKTIRPVRAALASKKPRGDVERMNETLTVWNPLTDRFVSFFLESVEGEAPRVQFDRDGKLTRKANGQPAVAGGWPCRRTPIDWRARGQALLNEYVRLRAEHRLCGKPVDPKSNLSRLRLGLEQWLAGTISGREVGVIRCILASSISRWGEPGSVARENLRAHQRQVGERATHHALRSIVVGRLSPLPDNSVLRALEPWCGAVTDQEAAKYGDAAAGSPIPSSVTKPLERCWLAAPEVLIERGVIQSAEMLAEVVTQIASSAEAESFEQPELRRLYRRGLMAFRQRRSLLLLNYAHRVRPSDLPWLDALERQCATTARVKADTFAALRTIARLAVTAFPAAPAPNPLVESLGSLANRAELELPLVEDLAADIFMGGFTGKFQSAAKIAAQLLRGTLYERYYQLPYDAVLALPDVHRRESDAPTAHAFSALCATLAKRHLGDRASHIVMSGSTIEHCQLLTTHNLAVLCTLLRLELSREELRDMSVRVFARVCRLLSGSGAGARRRERKAGLAWRQLVFFLSFLDDASVQAFTKEASETLKRARDPDFQRRFGAIVHRLIEVTQRSEAPGQAFVGWNTLER